MMNDYDIPSLENAYQHNDLNYKRNQSYVNPLITQNSQQKPIPIVNYPNGINKNVYNTQNNSYNIPQYNNPNLNVGCNNNQIGAGYYKNYKKIYICTENPNNPNMKMYEEIPLDEDIYYNNHVSEELIQTLINFLKVSGIGNIEKCVNYDQLLKSEFKEPHFMDEIIANDTSVNISKNSITTVSEELEYDDPIFGLYKNNRVEHDDQYMYSPVKYQYYCNFDKDLYVYTKDKIFVPVAKKIFNKDPVGLKEYVCIVKTYDLNPRYLGRDVISKAIEHIAFNASKVNVLKNESEIKKLKEISIKNSINYKNTSDEYLQPIRIRIVTYIPAFELRSNNYCLYIKSLGITISKKIMNYNIDKIENSIDEDKFINSIKVITDLSDNNDYYYQLNDKIITLPKTIDNTTDSKIILEEHIGKQFNSTEINIEDAKNYNIYTDKEELKSIIFANKNKIKELENKWKELDIKEKELSVKEKEIEFKQFKISNENESRNRVDTLEDFARSATTVIGVMTAAVGLGLACWKLYTTIRGR